jgi:hypothetical protein
MQASRPNNDRTLSAAADCPRGVPPDVVLVVMLIVDDDPALARFDAIVLDWNMPCHGRRRVCRAVRVEYLQ